MHEENVRHVLECTEAFDILIAPLRLDIPELLQRGDYLLSSLGSNEDIGSLRAGACKSFCSPISPMSDSHHSDASGMSLASSLPDKLHSESSFSTDYESAPRNASQYHRTGSLRPASRYSQTVAVETHRPQSPPSPPLHAQRSSLPKGLDSPTNQDKRLAGECLPLAPPSNSGEAGFYQCGNNQ